MSEVVSVIVFGVVLMVLGGALFLTPIPTWADELWLLPVGFVAAGLGLVIAGVVARVRRRLVTLRRAGGRSEVEAEGGPLRRFAAIPAMISSAWRRSDRGVSRSQTVLWLVAVVYLVSPIDLIPELLPVIGFTDDIGLAAWLLGSLYAEAGNYLGQKRRREHDIDAGR